MRNPSRLFLMNKELLLDVFEWDIANWSRAALFWQSHSNQNPESGNALEIGARHGGLSLWLALQGMKVVCSDLNYPSETAREKHKKYGVSQLITYENISALDIPYKNEFDFVIFKSVLGGVGRNNNSENIHVALKNMYDALKPGGELFFVENLKGSALHQFFRKKFVKWGESWNYLSIDQIREYTPMFSSLNYQTVGFLGAFGPNEKFRRIFGKLDKLIFDKITPSNWHYIFIGVARK